LLFSSVIYETTSKLELSLAYRIVGIDATPYCLDYWLERVTFYQDLNIRISFRADEENPNDAILSWGDVKGNVHAILFNSALIALFERPPQQTNDTCLYFNIHLIDLSI
jgi:hypothetical protein